MDASARDTGQGIMSESVSTTAPVTRTAGPSALQLGIVVAILGGGVLLTALTSNVTQVSEPGVKLVDGQPFLPDQAGGWQGGEVSGLSPEERAILPSDTEGARRVYKDAAGHEVFCSLVLAGRDVTSIHRPELCLQGQGWRWGGLQVMQVPVATAPGGRLEVSRLDAVHPVVLPDGRAGQVPGIFAYWFVGKDRTTPHHWQRILWTTMDRVFHNRNHRWAYFLVHVQVTTTPAEAAEVLSQFVRDLYPALSPH
jgi:EpsI family protein